MRATVGYETFKSQGKNNDGNYSQWKTNLRVFMSTHNNYHDECSNDVI